MSHDYKRKSATNEFLLTTISGIAYGGTNVLVGHPLDSVKVKMQAQTDYLKNQSFRKTVSEIYRNEGVLGFWKGWIPPLIGSSIFRSLQFAVMESAITKLREKYSFGYKKPFGLFSYETIVGGIAGGTARSIIECMSDNIKVRQQTGNKNWGLRDLYRGAPLAWLTTVGMFTTFCVLVEIAKEKTKLMENGNKFGQFLVGGVAGTLCWYAVWPIEYVKNMVQAETAGVGGTMKERFAYAAKTGGMFRGFLPGTLCFLLRNGFSYLAMCYVNELFFKTGLREKEESFEENEKESTDI